MHTVTGPVVLALHRRCALVTTDVARAILGVQAEAISAMIDEGRLRWAWDIRAKGGLREVRIWARELMAPGASIPVDAVLDAVIGTQREALSACELWGLLLCSRAHLRRLIEDGEIEGPMRGHTQYVWRSSFEAFLRRRLLPNTHAKLLRHARTRKPVTV